ncbi:hypothetical protein ACFQY0_08970 [Haloferula chungangensis]|uniref:Uncharacterized protein n=1 Tax=Haloferula chungangensis TaxID=1048331 RepID=A0ABW2L4L7_9BACT
MARLARYKAVAVKGEGGGEEDAERVAMEQLSFLRANEGVSVVTSQGELGFA